MQRRETLVCVTAAEGLEIPAAADAARSAIKVETLAGAAASRD